MGGFKIAIYESSSRGGNYKYAIELYKACQRNKKIDSTILILPSGSSYSGFGLKKILLADKLFKERIPGRIYFILRQLLNPFILFFWLLPRNGWIVLFNDFEQLSTPLWVPVYKLLLNKHTFGIYLHDPDRDAYPPLYAYSKFTMKLLTSLAEFSFYHGWLPEKPYYSNTRAKYIEVPHGLYEMTEADHEFTNHLKQFKGNSSLISILGNIRDEKNYEYAINVLVAIPDIKLLVAGSPSNSDVDVLKYKSMAQKLGVPGRIKWIEKYLSEPELSTLIGLSDIIWLYYKPTFNSHSGIFNNIAPYRKKVIISDINSSLTKLVQKYKCGELIPPNDQTSLEKGILRILNNPDENRWDTYLEYASWDKNIEIVVKSFSG